MKDYQRILLATDLSTPADNAGERAVDLAERYAAELILLHVIEFFPEDIPNDWIAPEDIDYQQFLADRAKESLHAYSERIGANKARREVQVSIHSARNQIIEFATVQGVDLIVVGSHGRHGLAALLGSTAYGVVNNARCDVLAVRAEG